MWASRCGGHCQGIARYHLLENSLLVLEGRRVFGNVSQTTIPTDEVDAEWLVRPGQWSIDKLLRFILFIGPISSIFDCLAFFDCWANPALFHTGWFVESLFTQT